MQSFSKENWHLSIFKSLSAFIALYFNFHGALFHSWRFISFMALYFIHGALFHSWRFYVIHGAFIEFMALLFFLHSAFCSCIALYSNVLSVSQHSFIFSKCESALCSTRLLSATRPSKLINGCQGHPLFCLSPGTAQRQRNPEEKSLNAQSLYSADISRQLWVTLSVESRYAMRFKPENRNDPLTMIYVQ
jgi:hypothetical protein